MSVKGLKTALDVYELTGIDTRVPEVVRLDHPDFDRFAAAASLDCMLCDGNPRAPEIRRADQTAIAATAATHEASATGARCLGWQVGRAARIGPAGGLVVTPPWPRRYGSAHGARRHPSGACGVRQCRPASAVERKPFR